MCDIAEYSRLCSKKSSWAPRIYMYKLLILGTQKQPDSIHCTTHCIWNTPSGIWSQAFVNSVVSYGLLQIYGSSHIRWLLYANTSVLAQPNIAGRGKQKYPDFLSIYGCVDMHMTQEEAVRNGGSDCKGMSCPPFLFQEGESWIESFEYWGRGGGGDSNECCLIHLFQWHSHKNIKLHFVFYAISQNYVIFPRKIPQFPDFGQKLQIPRGIWFSPETDLILELSLPISCAKWFN